MNMKLFILLLAMFLLAMPITFAANYIVFDYNQGKNEISNVNFVKDNQYYKEIYQDFENLEGYNVEIYSGNELIYSGQLQYNSLVPFNKTIANIKIYKNNKLVKESAYNFCNNNNKCEPCFGNCDLIENTLSCKDCGSGIKDNFCDLKKDNKCDPDCDNMDGDCACTGCYYDITDEELANVMKQLGQKEKINIMPYIIIVFVLIIIIATLIYLKISYTNKRRGEIFSLAYDMRNKGYSLPQTNEYLKSLGYKDRDINFVFGRIK